MLKLIMKLFMKKFIEWMFEEVENIDVNYIEKLTKLASTAPELKFRHALIIAGIKI